MTTVVTQIVPGTISNSSYPIHVLCVHQYLQGYKVYYTMSPDLPITLWTLHQVDNSQLTTISNLLTNRTYTVSVLAFTAVGDGPLSEPIKVRTQQGGMYLTLCPSPLCIYHATAFSKESKCYNVLLLMILVF